jgi:ferric-dicitrate binding protein FerR (iron transport regulator)
MNKQIRKYFQNELSLLERVEFLRALESDEQLKKQFIDYQSLKTLFHLLPQADDPVAGQRNFEAFMRDKKRRALRKIMRDVLKYAAIVLFLVGGTWKSFTYLCDSEETVMNTLYVPSGQRACLSLNDGTKIWLNAQSTLEYPSKFAKKERRVTLTGEAFFEVKKSEFHPFIVSTEHLEIKVQGTQFNVYDYPNTSYACTSLLEGSLKVCLPNKEAKSIVLKPNEEIYYDGDKMSVQTLKNSNNFLWRDGIYCFEKEPLANVIEKLERYYDIKIEIKDPFMLDLVYTAKFRQQDSIDEILRQLQKTHPFKIKKDKEKNVITLL